MRFGPLQPRLTALPIEILTPQDHSVLAKVSLGYPQRKGTLPKYYSPVRHYTQSEDLSRSTCMSEARRQRSF